MASQIYKQYHAPVCNHQRRLNFSPFDSEMNNFSDVKAAEMELWLQDATIADIQDYFEQERLTSEELVVYFLKRIQRYDGKLNSILEINPQALKIARALDHDWQVGNKRGYLHGIPIFVKDNIGTADQMHTSAGALVLQDAHSDQDAFIVSRLRDAGALILGKTNMTEWANFMTDRSANGFSVLGGQTYNPYGRFEVGGSSSGSAVAVAAHFAIASVGTETSGSITSPAGHNSVFGFKPSLGLLSRRRIIPITSKMDTPGPMARNVSDLSRMLTVLAGVDLQDPMTPMARELAGFDFTTCLDPEGLQGCRVGIIANSGYNPYKEDPKFLDRAAKILEMAGAQSQKIAYHKPILNDLDVMTYGIRYEVDEYLNAIGDLAPVKTMAEIVAFNQQDPENRAPYGQTYLEKSLKLEMGREKYERLARHNLETARRVLMGWMDGNAFDFILSIGGRFSGSYAPAGFPSVNIPCGYRRSGDPVGITLTGRYLSDSRLIAAAFAFETTAALRRQPILS
jgi:amidase